MIKKAAACIAVAIVIFVLFVATPPRPAVALPERAADDLLRDLRFGRVASAFERLPPNGFAEGTRVRERKYRLRWWWLYGREQEAPDTIALEYHVIRGWVPVPSPLRITVKKTPNGWRSVDFDAAY